MHELQHEENTKNMPSEAKMKSMKPLLDEYNRVFQLLFEENVVKLE